jgi:hypothetical protein
MQVTPASWLIWNNEAVLIFGKGFPAIRQKIPEAIDGMTHQAAKQVVKIFPGIDLEGLAGLDQAQE